MSPILPFVLTGLFLDGAHHDALHEVLLHKGINAQDGHGADDDHGVLDQRVQVQYVRGVVAGGVIGVVDVDQQDLAQEQLQRELAAILQIDHRVKPAVPLRHGVVEHHHGDGGLGAGHNDAEEDGKIPRAVQARGLLQALRDGAEGGAHHDHVPGADYAGQDDRHTGIIQSNALDDKEFGDHAAGKIHGEYHQQRKQLFEHQLGAGQRVRAQAGKEDAQHRAHHHIEDGVGIADADIGVLQHGAVALQAEAQV